MAFLLVNGVEYLVSTQGAAEKQPTRIGESVRAFDGSLRSTVRGVKRSWVFALAPMPAADALALRAAVDGGAFVVCGGDALGGAPVTCEVVATETPYVDNYPGFLRGMSVTLQEV